ncbi:MAG: PKD domain-containing protein [Candidatus Diapherotrites archaeon]|nr:PKD domain-containing protein [Candidatus Diapherotrites archaeon]
MSTRYIPFVLFFLLLSVSVQSASWSIAGLKTNKTSLTEGELFEASVVVDGDAENLTYTWSFGDNSEKLQLTEPKAYHVFYIDDTAYSKEFQVSVVVSDGEAFDVQSVTVKVKRARSGSAKIKPFGPEFFKLHSKSEPIMLSFEVLDCYDNILDQSKIRNIDVSIKGEKPSISQEGVGLYRVELSPRFYFNYVEFLDISIEANLGRGYQKFETKLPIYFSSAELEIPSNPIRDKKVYIGVPLGEIETQILYPDNSSVTSGEFYASIISDSNIIEKTKLAKKDNTFSAKFEHAFSLEDIEKKFSLVLEGKDSYGNILKRKEYEFTISKDNPLFNLVVLQPELSSGKEFGFGQEVTIETELRSTAGIENAEVFLAIPALRIKKYFNKEDSKYILNFTFPSRQVQNAELQIIATGIVSGKELADFEIYSISTTNLLNIDFIYPIDAGKANTVFEEDNMLKVGLSYPDGSLVKIPEIKAVLYLDGKRKNITLEKDPEKGYYFYKFDEPLINSHTLKLVLTGTFSGTKEIKADIVQPPAWSAVVTFLLILAILGILVYVVYSRFMQWRTEQLKLSDRIVQLEHKMNLLQKDLFRGKVTPKQYKEKMLLLQNEKETIKERLSATPTFSHFISGLIRSLIPKRKSALKQIVVAPLPKLPPKQPAEKPKEEIPKEKKEFREVKAPRAVEEKKRVEERPIVKSPKAVSQKGRVMQAEPAKPEEVVQPQKPMPQKKLSTKEELMEIKRKIVPEKEEEHAAIPAAQTEAFSPEDVAEINRLYRILKPMAEKYKAGELFRALIAEGYKPTIALAVIEKIFKEKRY